jgi:hypothetical protein
MPIGFAASTQGSYTVSQGRLSCYVQSVLPISAGELVFKVLFVVSGGQIPIPASHSLNFGFVIHNGPTRFTADTGTAVSGTIESTNLMQNGSITIPDPTIVWSTASKCLILSSAISAASVLNTGDSFVLEVVAVGGPGASFTNWYIDPAGYSITTAAPAAADAF